MAEWDGEGAVTVNEWLKQAILLLFRVQGMDTIELGPFEYADKLPLKRDYEAKGVRVVPGASARWGSFLDRGVVMMPSYVNIGARVGANTMVDTWATVGSCAQIGANVAPVRRRGHRRRARAAAGRAGDDRRRVLHRQPLHRGRGGHGGRRARCSAPARSSPPRCPVIDAETRRGDQPGPRPAVVAWPSPPPGPATFPGGDFGLPCVLVIKRLTEGERHDKGALNDILRDHGVATWCPMRRHDAASAVGARTDGARATSPSREPGREAPITDHLDGRCWPGCPASSGPGWATTSWPAPTWVGRCAWSWPATPTPCRPTATPSPRSTATPSGGSARADMKGGLAVMLELALAVPEPAVDVTYVFYAREEIAAKESGLEELFVERPDLLAGDVAILGEPTDGEVEAGCQGTLRLRGHAGGERAHTARPWMGRNAVHRLGPLLSLLDAHEPRQPVIEGCQFREALQAVRRRAAAWPATWSPTRPWSASTTASPPTARPRRPRPPCATLLAPVLEDGDTVELVDVAAGRAPALDHPLLAALVERNGLGVRAKLGWTDVARFAARGIPAVNFGPGDSTLAHTADERVEGDRLDVSYRALLDLITVGP